MLSSRIKRITPSPTLAIDAKAKELAAKGEKIINFSAGEPDFGTPEVAKQEAVAAINENFTRYTATPGILELRQAIVRKLEEDNGLVYGENQILISAGAKHSLYNVFMTLVDEGDEVLLPAPYWVSYPEQIKLAGGIPVIMPTTAESGYKITPEQLEKAITSKTKVLLLNSPNNPSGVVYTKAELEGLAEVLLRSDIHIVSDEIYEYLVYDGVEHVSIASLHPELKERTVTINGVSKSYAMTGWRIGYAAGRQDIIKGMSNFQGHTTSNATSIAQRAALAAINEGKEPVKGMVNEYVQRRNYMYERLIQLPGVRCEKAMGAFYLFPDVSGLFFKKYRGREITDSNVLAEILLDAAKVAVVPGDGFGAKDNLRLSYATSMKNIIEGLDQMAKVILEIE